MKTKYLEAAVLLTMLFSTVGCSSKTSTSELKEGIYFIEDRDGNKRLHIDDPYEGVIKSQPLSKKTIQFYLNDDLSQPGKLNTTKTADVVFYDKNETVPYMELGNITNIFVDIFQKYLPFNLELSRSDEGNYVLKNKSGNYISFDLDKNTVFCDDFNAIGVVEGNKPLDLVNIGSYADDANLIKHESRRSIKGKSITIDFNYYGIHMALLDDKCYIPVATFNDLLIANTGLTFLYNGKDLFLTQGGSSLVADGHKTEFGSYYFLEQKTKRDDYLIKFTYKELCFSMDLSYGLKSQHGINEFNTYFIQTGLIDNLISDDPGVFYEGIQLLTNCYFNDGHSGSHSISALYGDPDYFLDPENWNERVRQAYTDRMGKNYTYKIARTTQTGDIKPKGYFEVGDTAYIQFDMFISNRNIDYYKITPTNNVNDTIELLLYSDKQIRRTDSPIKNVVLDLSNNVGGHVDAAACVASYFSFNAPISCQDVLTGAKSSNSYYFDANLNHKYGDEELGDTLYTQYNLFCITSPASFSCGNLIPAIFKNSSRVTLLGKKSGGGTCVVGAGSTADGCTYQISSPTCMSVEWNGSFYDIDRGVEPDYNIDVGNMYNTTYLNNFIHSIVA